MEANFFLLNYNYKSRKYTKNVKERFKYLKNFTKQEQPPTIYW